MFMIQNRDPRTDSPECCATQAICISFLCLYFLSADRIIVESAMRKEVREMVLEGKPM